MGELYAFDLQPLITEYDLKVYFETGTGRAISLQHALKYPFKKFYSIDIDKELIQAAKPLSRIHNNIEFRAAYSKDGIQDLVPQINKSEPTLFFLDAHFPGADFHKISYEQSIREYQQDAFPLLEEIELIQKLRDTSKDVFIIDDLMIYEDGDYGCLQEGVFWKYEWLQRELGIETSSESIYKSFKNTHLFKKDLRHQGYLIVTPLPPVEKK